MDKIVIIAKDKKCKCGKMIPKNRHHFLCDSCWRQNKRDGHKKMKAIMKNYLMYKSGYKRAKEEELEFLSSITIPVEVDFYLLQIAEDKIKKRIKQLQKEIGEEKGK